VSPVLPAASALAAQIADLTAERGRRVSLNPTEVLDRSTAVRLQTPSIWSPNRSCQLVETLDGWIAVNLPREADLWSVPAWIGCELEAEPRAAIRRVARDRPWRDLVAGARLLGLPVAGVGEITWDRLAASCPPMGVPGIVAPGPLKVVDMSSLWAGPLCGSILAECGAQVAKIESRSRPDTARLAAPGFYERLNRGKTKKSLDFGSCEDREWLRRQILEADVLITGARRRAFDDLGLSPEGVFAANPQLVWVAITGYGFLGESADRVAFGDDAAAAGGLVKWTPSGKPNFVGDALADPLTGLAAAAGALLALKGGGGRLIDAAMAEISAAAARTAVRELHR
jgi:CoA-transferase family III